MYAFHIFHFLLNFADVALLIHYFSPLNFADVGTPQPAMRFIYPSSVFFRRQISHAGQRLPPLPAPSQYAALHAHELPRYDVCHQYGDGQPSGRGGDRWNRTEGAERR